MQLHYFDWVVILFYLLISSFLVLWYTKKTGTSHENYFLKGRFMIYIVKHKELLINLAFKKNRIL